MTFGGARDIQIENNLFGRHTCQIEKRTVCRDDEDAGRSFFQFGALVLQATVILGLFDLSILRLTANGNDKQSFHFEASVWKINQIRRQCTQSVKVKA